MRRLFDKDKAVFWFAFLVVIALSSLCDYAFGNSLGLTYSQIIDDRSLGITGDYSADLTERVTFEADVQAQAGDVYNATINTDFVIDVAAVDFKILVANKLKGYTLDGLGREQSLGLALTLPVDKLNFDVGVGGKNASPFSASNALETLTAAGFDEQEIAGKGLAGIIPKATGIPFKNGNTLNAFITTGFAAGIFDVDVKGVIELLGEGDKMHQVNTTLRTDGKIGNVLITTAIEVGLASYQDLIHREIATVTTAGIEF